MPTPDLYGYYGGPGLLTNPTTPIPGLLGQTSSGLQDTYEQTQGYLPPGAQPVGSARAQYTGEMKDWLSNYDGPQFTTRDFYGQGGAGIPAVRFRTTWSPEEQAGAAWQPKNDEERNYYYQYLRHQSNLAEPSDLERYGEGLLVAGGLLTLGGAAGAASGLIGAGTGAAGAAAVPAAAGAGAAGAAGAGAAAGAGTAAGLGSAAGLGAAAALPEIVVTGTLGGGIGAGTAAGLGAAGLGAGLLASGGSSGAGAATGFGNAPTDLGYFANGGTGGMAGVGGGNAGLAAANGVIPGGAGMGTAVGGSTGLGSLSMGDYMDMAGGLLGGGGQQQPQGGAVMMPGQPLQQNPAAGALLRRQLRAQALRRKQKRTVDEELELRELNQTGLLG